MAAFLYIGTGYQFVKLYEANYCRPLQTENLSSRAVGDFFNPVVFHDNCKSSDQKPLSIGERVFITMTWLILVVILVVAHFIMPVITTVGVILYSLWKFLAAVLIGPFI